MNRDGLNAFLESDAFLQSFKDLLEKYSGAGNPDDPGPKFIDSAFSAFSKKALDGLYEILTDDPENVPENIKAFFEKTAQNFLPYTAFPEHEVTLFLCDIAEFAAAALNDKGVEGAPFTAINLLFPSVNTESASDDWPHLGVYHDAAGNKIIPEYLPNPREVIRTHILSSNSLYFIPVKQLPEIIENDKKGELSNNYYYIMEKVGEENSQIKKDEIDRLINHSKSTESLNQAALTYNALLNAEPENLYTQLEILCHSLLINSVSMRGEELDAGSGVYQAVINFQGYYDLLEKYYAELDKNETSDLKKDDEPHLAKKKERAKKAEKVGESEEIENAKKAEKVERIPENLKQEVDRLLSIVKDPKLNAEAMKDATACIATCRQKILEAMQGKEETLIKIKLGESKKEKNIEDARKRYEETKMALVESLERRNYRDGHDKVRLIKIRPTFDWLGIEPLILSRNNLELFTSFERDDSKRIAEEYNSKNQIADLFENSESFESFVFSAKLDILKETFFISDPLLIEKFLNNGEKLLNLITSLSKERAQIVCEAFCETFESERGLKKKDFKNEILPLIRNFSDLITLERNFPKKYVKIILNALKEEKYNFSETKDDSFGWFLAKFDDGFKMIKYLTGDALEIFIRSQFDLVIAMQKINDINGGTELKLNILNKVGEKKLTKWFNNRFSLNSLLQCFKDKDSLERVLPLLKGITKDAAILLETVKGLDISAGEIIKKYYLETRRNQVNELLKEYHAKALENETNDIATIDAKNLPKTIEDLMDMFNQQFNAYTKHEIDHKDFKAAYLATLEDMKPIFRANCTWTDDFMSKLCFFIEDLVLACQNFDILELIGIKETLEMNELKGLAKNKLEKPPFRFFKVETKTEKKLNELMNDASNVKKAGYK